MRQRTIFTTLFSIFLAIILLSIGVAAIYSITTFNNFIYKNEKVSLIEKTEMLLELFPANNIINEDLVITFANSTKDQLTRITIVDINGSVIADSIKQADLMDNHLSRPEIEANLLGSSRIVSRYSETLKEKMIYYSLPIKNKSDVIGFLRTSISIEQLNDRVKVVSLTIGIIRLVIILIAVAICYILAMKISLTVNSIKRVAKFYSKGDFNYTLNEDGTKELVSLSKSINNMGFLLQDRFFTIRKQKNRYKSMLESMVEPVIRIDNNFIIDETNRSAQELFNKKGSEIKGLSLLELTKSKNLYEFCKKCLARDTTEKCIIGYESDMIYHFQVHGSILYDAEKTTLGLLLVLNDLTEHVRLENMRKEFVANVSHELRTPATAIQGYAETLMNNEVSTNQRQKFLSILYSNSIRLNSIIDDLLILAGLEKSDASFQFDKFPATDLVSSALNALSSSISNREIIIDIRDEIVLMAHPLLLEQALINLITNAIKYSPQDVPIYIRVGEEDRKLFIEVEDMGCGISEWDQAKIFERFFRVDRARSRDQGGTGLGLSIVKRVMDIHGGTASVKSILEKGSIFRLTIPCCH